MLFLWGLYEQQKSHFFFLILISTNKHSTLSGVLYSVSKPDGISSLIKRRIPPPFEHRSVYMAYKIHLLIYSPERRCCFKRQNIRRTNKVKWLGNLQHFYISKLPLIFFSIKLIIYIFVYKKTHFTSLFIPHFQLSLKTQT